MLPFVYFKTGCIRTHTTAIDQEAGPPASTDHVGRSETPFFLPPGLCRQGVVRRIRRSPAQARIRSGERPRMRARRGACVEPLLPSVVCKKAHTRRKGVGREKGVGLEGRD